VSAHKTGSNYVLAIGIQNYRQLKKLSTPRNDAKEVAKVLHDQYGFETTVLLDATRRQILDALDHYRAALHEADNLVVYYAGHGYYDAGADLAYWAPADAENNSHDDWIVANEITGAVRAIPARHVLIVSDSCYSGLLVRDVTPHFGTVEYDTYLERVFRGKSRSLMSSGGKEPVADGDGSHSNHSVFANALLAGLRDFNMDSFAAEDLFNRYVRQKVAGRSSQLPEYSLLRNSGHEDGDFVFFRWNAKRRTSRGATVADPGASASVAKASAAPDSILRNFHTMFIETRGARFFGSNQLKAALVKNADFASLNVVIVDDPQAADVVLEVSYTFPWDYPFELKHQSTSVVLLAGKGSGPLSGTEGADSVAREWVKLAKPYRAQQLDKRARQQ
jgi:hypothetical protein